jgi:hypothetical protein
MPIVTKSRIQQSTFQIACRICEHPEAKVVHNILTKHFGRQGTDLLNKQGLKPIENLKSVSVPRGDDEIEAEIINKGDGNFCYWDNGWVDIASNDVRQYQLDLNWMLRWIKSSLHLPANNIAKPLAEERIWSLGDIRLRDKKAHVIFVRRPRSKEVMKSLNDNLKEKYRSKPILIVTTARHIESFALPGNSYIAYIGDLITNDKFLKFDLDEIHAKMFGQAANGTFSTGFRTAFLDGMQFSFTKLQAAIIETLHEHGRPMHKTEFMHLHSRQDDPKHIFRSNGKYHPAWGTLINFDKQGNYWLAK